MTQTKEDSRELLSLLKNQGFSAPEAWLNYARQHHFKKIHADRLDCCPDCSHPSYEIIGQYVYYSNLMTLRMCCDCELVYSDTRLDPEVIAKHFESAYKEESYFLERRRTIFDQIIGLVEHIAPVGGRVIDIGGAKGHLMAGLKRRRPDLDITVNDLSPLACAWCESEYGFKTICRPAAALEKTESYDVLLMIDVLYYEAQIGQFWRRLPNLVSDRGTVIIRIPNREKVVRLYQSLLRLTTSQKRSSRLARVNLFNPEHLYLVPRPYLVYRFM